jgi:hypothetical protein
LIFAMFFLPHFNFTFIFCAVGIIIFKLFCDKSRVSNSFAEICRRASMVNAIYRVSQEECARLREGVPYVKGYRYNPKHLCPKLNGYGDNGQRSLKL